MVMDGIEYLGWVQLPQGFPFQRGPGAFPDANSTAVAVQALIAAGEDPAATEWQNAAGALLAFQNPSGAFRYSHDTPEDNLFATVQAIPAAAGLSFPLRSADATPAATPGAVPTCPAGTPVALETPAAVADLPCAA
jgi:hypothetical protein